LTVPAEFVKQALDAVGDDYKPIRPGYLGIVLDRTQPEVLTVIPESPAASADIAKGDIILEIDAKKATTAKALSAAIATRRPGDKVEFTVKRGEEVKQITITLGERLQSPRPTARRPDTSSVYAPAVPPEDVRIIREYNTPVPDVTKKPTPPPIYAPTPAQPLTIRVERSDLDEKVESLHKEVVKLREQIKALQESLEK
jgi:membrane-associated protease RseP (regulator of RpoE activity)